MTLTTIGILNGCFFLLIGALVAGFKLRDWWLDRDKERVPVSEKLLRAPGESRRQKIEDLSDKLTESLLAATVLPATLATNPIFFEARLSPVFMLV